MNSQGTPGHGTPRTVAFYLPQFHAIAENDQWWGKGFTEWTNVRKAKPIFTGHDQPRAPADLGYYDLRDGEVMHRQAQMAAEHGVDAFCFYFYWFAGQRLLEAPVDGYLEMGPNFPFCLSWANENWTRRWDGKNHEVLMAQDYSHATAPDVFDAFLPFLRDERYLRVDGAAVLLVHRSDHIPDPRRLARTWRELALQHRVGPLHLVAAETTPGLDPRTIGFDAVAEFPPVGANTIDAGQLSPVHGLSPSFNGRLMSYDRMAAKFRRRRTPPFIRHRGVMPGWDNTARRGNKGTVFVGSSPASYGRWLKAARDDEGCLRGEAGLVFVNAWNEWAEGAYLEPDATFGTAYLQATHDPLSVGLPETTRSRAGALGLSHLRACARLAAGTLLAVGRRAAGRFRHGRGSVG